VRDTRGRVDSTGLTGWLEHGLELGSTTALAHELPGLVRRDRHEPLPEVLLAVDLADPLPGNEPRSLRGLVSDAAMSRLDPDDRALLAMRYVAGFDSNELARATGISPSGTRSRIERLLKRLREDLRDG
jgi:DNA-directed RNA polymerase specialized sigma24 family protein